MVLVTIAFETSLAATMPSETADPLLPTPLSSPLTTSDETPKDNDSPALDSPYALDLRLALIINRLRHPPPPPSSDDDASQDLLPLPNNTSLNSIRMLVRARAQLQERTRALEAAARRRRARDEDEDDENDEDRQRRVPGAMDTDDGS